jgi:hypothetical protein
MPTTSAYVRIRLNRCLSNSRAVTARRVRILDLSIDSRSRDNSLLDALNQSLASQGYAIIQQDLPEDLARAIAVVVRVGLTMFDERGNPKPFPIHLAIAREIVIALRREALVGTPTPTANRRPPRVTETSQHAANAQFARHPRKIPHPRFGEATNQTQKALPQIGEMGYPHVAHEEAGAIARRGPSW